MYGIDDDDYNYWIYRLMIDKHFQGSGLGRHAIKLIIEEIRQTNDANIPLIMIGYNPENTAAKHAYKKAGFVESHIAPCTDKFLCSFLDKSFFITEMFAYTNDVRVKSIIPNLRGDYHEGCYLSRC